jgi:ribulose-phosphate 3-epimerase
MQNWIAPSILAADFARLGDEVCEVLEAGADIIHFDVMDNHYVPNLSIGPLVLTSLRKHGIKAPIDVHLMVKPVDRLIGDFIEAGADYISIHPESTEHPHSSLNMIRRGGAKPGLVLNPGTPLSHLDHLLAEIDLVLIMSVNPGFGGQSFIRASLDKVRAARKRLDTVDREVRLEIDGGIKVDNIASARSAGADTFVAGSAIFDSGDYRKTIAAMRAQLERTQPDDT